MNINVTGNRYCDLVLYLSRILLFLGKSVLIHDLTGTCRMKAFIPILPDFDADTEIYEYRGIGYTAAVRIDEAGYDYIFRLLDPVLQPDELYESADLNLAVVDEDPCHAAVFERSCGYFLSGDSDKNILVLRDYTGLIKDQFAEASEKVTAKRIYRIPYSKADRKAELIAAYREDIGFRHISGKFGVLLEDMVSLFADGTDSKSIDRAYSLAEKGGRL